MRVSEREREMKKHILTSREDQHVSEAIECPDVGCPVGVAEPSLEGEQSREELTQLALERWREDSRHADPQG